MENNEIKMLIDTFKEYRNLLTPIEQSLQAFSSSFDGVVSDIKRLNESFDGDVQSKLEKIYKELSSQADKSRTLSLEVDKFLSATQKYTSGVDKLISLAESIEGKINTLNAVEEKAESQIARLDTLIEEKKRTYDIRGLEKKLEAYNVGVQKVSDYINKDVSDALQDSVNSINDIRNKSNGILETVKSEYQSIEKLAESYDNSTKFLKKVVENNEVNEEYLFEVLDRWAESRRVKTKK